MLNSEVLKIEIILKSHMLLGDWEEAVVSVTNLCTNKAFLENQLALLYILVILLETYLKNSTL